MRTLYLISVWLHLVAATLWIGGMLFLVLVMAPLLARAEDPNAVRRVFHAAALAFRNLGWAALGVLAGTGAINLLVRAGGVELLATPAFWQGTFGRTLLIKLALFLTVLTLSLVHDFVVGPRATDAIRSDPASARARRLRVAASWMGRLNLLLALMILGLAVRLVR